MPLKLRPTGLGSGIDKDRPTTTIVTGEWAMAASQYRGGPRQSALVLVDSNGPMTRSDRVATLEEPRRSFKRAGTPGRRGRSWKR